MKIGSKMAARYSESMGDVNEEAIMLEGPGTRWALPLARDPFLTPSICRSIHHIPGMPRIIHNMAFFASEPRGIHCRKRKYDVATVRKKGSFRANKKM